MTEFARKVTAYMQARGLDESKLARKLGVAPSNVHRWLKGQHAPRGRNVIKLVRLVPSLKPGDFDVVPAPAVEPPTSPPAA